MTEYNQVYHNLKPQFVAILKRFTKSTRVDEMATQLVDCVIRDAPKVQVQIPVEHCTHVMRVEKAPDGHKHLACKHCGRVKPLTFQESED